MFNILGLLAVIASTPTKETVPTESTINNALVSEEENPAILDIKDEGLVPVEINTKFVNPDRIPEVKEVPDWMTYFLEEQVRNSPSNNWKSHPVFMGDAIAIFPGITTDPNNNVSHHILICELQAVTECPEGYKKVHRDLFRKRSKEELFSLLSDKAKKEFEKKHPEHKPEGDKKPEGDHKPETEKDADINAGGDSLAEDE